VAPSVQRRRVWLTPTTRVPYSNTAKIGERKTWTQCECCTWKNSVCGYKADKHPAKFGWLPLSDVAAATKPKRETRWNLLGFSKLTKRSQPLIDRSSPYCEESWTQALIAGFGIDVLYLDYRKAFDSVPHKRLLEQLKSYGISGKLLRWIQSFLEERLIRVGIICSFSDWIKVAYWVEFRKVRYWDLGFSYSSLMIYETGSRIVGLWECLQMTSRPGVPSGQMLIIIAYRKISTAWVGGLQSL